MSSNPLMYASAGGARLWTHHALYEVAETVCALRTMCLGSSDSRREPTRCNWLSGDNPGLVFRRTRQRCHRETFGMASLMLDIKAASSKNGRSITAGKVGK